MTSRKSTPSTTKLLWSAGPPWHSRQLAHDYRVRRPTGGCRYWKYRRRSCDSGNRKRPRTDSTTRVGRVSRNCPPPHLRPARHWNRCASSCRKPVRWGMCTCWRWSMSCAARSNSPGSRKPGRSRCGSSSGISPGSPLHPRAGSDITDIPERIMLELTVSYISCRRAKKVHWRRVNS